MKHRYFKYDITVLGGGPSGLSAAVTATRMDKRVLPAGRNGYLGGSPAIGLSPLSFRDTHGRPCAGGFPGERRPAQKRRHRQDPLHSAEAKGDFDPSAATNEFTEVTP